MNSSYPIIETISEKISLLANERNQLQNTIQQLQDEVKQLHQKEIGNKKELDELRHKYDVLKMAKSLDGETENKKDLKLKINEMVREIDRCIALLNK